MSPTKEIPREPLPNGGLQVLTDLITHQDSTTWTVVSVFLAAEIVLLALYVQQPPTLSTMGTLGVFGLLITIVSWFIVNRSNTYLEAYYKLAKNRCHPQDLEIFDLRFEKKIPTARYMLRLLHWGFFILWLILTVGYGLFLSVLASRR